MKTTYRSITDLATIPVPRATRSYCPVAQRDLWEETANIFDSHGFRINGEQHMVHHKNPVFVSKANVFSKDLPDIPGQSWEIGLMNSYDMSTPVRIIFGASVFVCTNGLIVADHILKTKHTTNVWDRLPNLITKAMFTFTTQVEAYSKRQEILKRETTTAKDLSEFTVRLAQRGILNKSKMLDFYEESVVPSFDYQTPTMSLWNLQAAFTHLVKESNPVLQPRAVLEFDRTMDQFYALA